MQLVIISGVSGSGKSVALNVLEDSSYYCIDNLPEKLLPETVQVLRDAGTERAALAIDARSGSLALLPAHLQDLGALGVDVQVIFLEAKNETLIRRFAETRRRHPLASGQMTLEECLARERELLGPVEEVGHKIDTSDTQPNTLRKWIRELLAVQPGTMMILFESFGYKQGVPLDADLVFDVRCLPNPHYDPKLRPLTGLDAEVVAFLEREAEVVRMLDDVRGFLEKWLPSYARDARSYFTVALGCTGGQHRSVFFVERLAAHFRPGHCVLVRHRQLEGN